MDVRVNPSQQTRSKRVTVPEIYRKAARILKSAEERKGSLKNLIYSSGFRDVKPLYALVAESCKHQIELDELVNNTAGLQNVQPFDPHLARILITELLWGKGYLKPENARAIRIILELENDLRQALDGMNSQEDKDSIHQISAPRYVRVNTLVSTTEKVCTKLIAEGWKQVKSKKKTGYEGFIERVKSLSENEFIMDFHLDFLLVFPSSAQFHNHDFLRNGSILLQDKASCLSAVALQTKPFYGKMIDACSAPGMKTSLLAALSNNQSSIIAIERDAKRCNTLRQTVSNARASKVSVQRADFLNLDPSDYQDVKYILVDPSCSGTGIVNRLDPKRKPEEGASLELRLKRLSSLQSRLVEHAATFPSVERIVYSTCSIHEEENEAVVRQVLSKIGNSFRLDEALPWWPRRGTNSYDNPPDDIIGLKCVRAEAEKDLTNGFFIALFVRMGES
ncbi:28S rRNA (cytosine-C(5))-methyltransferase-like [Daphnia pulex]|uniref:28S rRNA (cytosine-C(5))-methyltransferase-like n=1 Tax=Daphnia pulex TaxID=6669 RepID=UPI001EE139B9|nr:28S rRNA (cytosine-C(5))-methyltransferase-like [Daphnia pulex]